MIFGSVCSGIEAASVAWEPLGWRAAFVSEIDPFPSAVLSHRYPETENLGDFTRVGASAGPIDLLVGGKTLTTTLIQGVFIRIIGTEDFAMNEEIEDRYRRMFALYQEGKTLDDVGLAFGVGGSAVSRAFRLMGFPTRPLSSPRHKDPLLGQLSEPDLVERKRQWDQLSTQAKGTVAENAVANRLVELGFVVWTPYVANTKADLAVAIKGKIVTVQVKSASYDPATKRFRAMLVTRENKSRKHVSYKPGEVDFFAIYCPGLDDKYIIPAKAAEKRTNANLIPHRGRLRAARSEGWERYKNAFDLLREER